MKRNLLLLAVVFSSMAITAQTWIDTLDNYTRTIYRPPLQYKWTWVNAPVLHAMELQYEMMPEEEKQKYVNYVRTAMNQNILIANGWFPNGVASANGLAFLYRVTGNELYRDVALKVFRDYQAIIRTSNGGCSHIAYAPELWDDTVYMIGVFLLAMYRATGDEDYLNELIEQVRAHKEKLEDEATGLWVHGWDGDNDYDLDFCSEFDWADPVTRRSSELWSRGNGWVVVTLSEMLNNMDESHPDWDFVASSLVEMIENLPTWQDSTTGHWYQLTVRVDDPENYIESSSTAMFGYGILTALKYDLVSDPIYERSVEKVYDGLRKHSIFTIQVDGVDYYNIKNVARETCIGDKDYYLNIVSGTNKPYTFGMFIIFGRAYEEIYFDDEITSISNSFSSQYNLQIVPNFLTSNYPLNISINAKAANQLTFEIVDILGRVLSVDARAINIGSNTTALATDNLQKGQYFLVVRSENGDHLVSKRFMVQ